MGRESTSEIVADPVYPQRTRRLAIASLLLVWVAFNYPVFAGDVLFPVDLARAAPPQSLGADPPAPSNPLEGDALTYYYPLRTYVGERIRGGDLPLWDPHRFTGTGFAGISQAAVFYPPTWSFGFGSTLTVYSLSLVLSRLLALLLFYWFLRVLRLHPFAAVAGAATFVFSGFLTAWGVHLTFISSAMWLPLALGGLTLAIERRRAALGTGLAGLGLGLSILGGHAQITIYVWLAAAVWAAALTVAEAWRARSTGWLRAGGRAGLLTGGAFVLGAGLAAIQLLATAELSGHIVRGMADYPGLASTAFPKRHLATFLIPDYFGNPLDGNHISYTNYTEAGSYAGILALALIVPAVWRRWDRHTAGFGALGTVAALAAFGTPMFYLLYRFVPGISRVRGPGRIVVLVDAAVAGLAAVGLDRALTGWRRSRVAVLGGVGLLGVALLAIPFVFTREPTITWTYLAPKFAVAGGLLVLAAAAFVVLSRRPAALGLVLVGLIGADLWAFGYRYHRFQEPAPIYPEVAEVGFLRAQPERSRFIRVSDWWLLHNAGPEYRLFDVQGYDTFIDTHTVDLLSIPQDQHLNTAAYNVVYNVEPPALTSPIFDLVGVRHVLWGSKADTEAPPVFRDRFQITERPTALPAAFVARCADLVGPGEAIPRLTEMSTDELRATAVVEEATRTPRSDCAAGAEAEIRNYAAERVDLTVNDPAGGILVLTDAWDRGWTARVDGRPTPVLRVDHALRGVEIGPGAHQVVFEYRPGWLVPGAAVSLGSLLVMLLLVIGAPPRRAQASGSQRNE